MPLAVTLLPLFALRAAVELNMVPPPLVLAMHQQKMPVAFESINIRVVPFGWQQFVIAFLDSGQLSLAIGIAATILNMMIAWVARARLDRSCS